MVAAALPAVLNITGVAAAFALLYAFRSVLWPFALALVLAILINALVRTLVRTWPRAGRLTVFILAGAVVGAMVLLSTFLVVAGATELLGQAPMLVQRLAELLALGSRLVQLEAPLSLKSLGQSGSAGRRRPGRIAGCRVGDVADPAFPLLHPGLATPHRGEAQTHRRVRRRSPHAGGVGSERQGRGNLRLDPDGHRADDHGQLGIGDADRRSGERRLLGAGPLPPLIHSGSRGGHRQRRSRPCSPCCSSPRSGRPSRSSWASRRFHSSWAI